MWVGVVGWSVFLGICPSVESGLGDATCRLGHLKKGLESQAEGPEYLRG